MENLFARGNESLEEFLSRFPDSDYIHVLPILCLQEALPDYLTVGIELLKVNPGDEKQAYKEENRFALHAPIWERIGFALGLKWVPALCGRLDGREVKTYGRFRSGAVLTNLSGMTPIICEYDFDVDLYAEEQRIKKLKFPPQWTTWPLSRVRPDLYKQKGEDRNARFDELPEELKSAWIDIEIRGDVVKKTQNLHRLIETGSRTRVIRKISGLPHSFPKADLEKKHFAILKIIFRPPSPQTEGERIALNRTLIDRFLPAFGGSSPEDTPPALGAGAAPEVHYLEPGRGPVAGAVEIPISDEPEDFEQGAGVSGAPGAPTLPVDGPDAENNNAAIAKFGASGDDPAGEGDDFAANVGRHMIEIAELTGNKDSVRAFVYGIFRKLGYSSLKEIVDPDHRAEVLSALSAKLDYLCQNPEGESGASTAAEDAPGKHKNPIIQSRLTFYGDKPTEVLERAISATVRSNNYPMSSGDPKGIVSLLGPIGSETPDAQKRGAYLKALARLMEYGIENFKK